MDHGGFAPIPLDPFFLFICPSTLPHVTLNSLPCSGFQGLLGVLEDCPWAIGAHFEQALGELEVPRNLHPIPTPLALSQRLPGMGA